MVGLPGFNSRSRPQSERRLYELVVGKTVSCGFVSASARQDLQRVHPNARLGGTVSAARRRRSNLDRHNRTAEGEAAIDDFFCRQSLPISRRRLVRLDGSF